MTSALLLLALAAAVSLVLTPLVRTFARARGWMDQPDGGRKRHATPVPRVGGLAVFGSFVLASGLLLASGAAPWDGQVVLAAYAHLVAAGAAVLAVGLLDDVFGVRPVVKLVVQAGAAGYLYAHGYRIESLSNPFGGETVSLGVLALPLTLLWFVGMSNAFNLIDGLDGLAAGIGFFSTITLFIAAVVNERWEVVLLSAALSGALLGFLRYNFAPASIFLGDSGALFVGFALAAFAIRGSMKSSAAIAVAAPLLALAIPILDATIAVARRLLSGHSVFEADGDHIHHRLLRKGLTPARVAATLYGAAALFGALSLLTMTEKSQVIGLVVIASSVVTWIGIQQLGYAEFGELPRLLRQGLLQERQVLANNVWLSKLPERLQACADENELRELLSECVVRLGFESAEWLPAEAPQAAWHFSGTAGHDDGARVDWRVPLRHAGRLLGRLELHARPGAQSFDSARLLLALEQGLAPRLLALAAQAQAGPENTPARRPAPAALGRPSGETEEIPGPSIRRA